MSDKINKKRERGANYTPEEKTLLIDLIMQYKHIVEDKSTGGQMKIMSKNVSTGQKKIKKGCSSEALKRIYFKKKCENAYLERRKIMKEILNAKQEHNLKMLILKKKLDNLSKC